MSVVRASSADDPLPFLLDCGCRASARVCYRVRLAEVMHDDPRVSAVEAVGRDLPPKRLDEPTVVVAPSSLLTGHATSGQP